MATKDDLITAMSAHQGSSYGITALNLAALLNITPRAVRALVSEARMEGIALCGQPNTGYYIANTAEELEETCHFLRGRALHSLTIEARLRRVPLADLVGQIRLPT